MASNNYEDKLCEAIEYIVDKAILNAGYDKTIQATVIEQIDKTIGKYKIRYQDSTFIAYAESADKNYSKGSLVYVLVPRNDMSQHKTILGTTDKLGVNYISNPEGEDVFEKVGTNCIETDKEIELCTYEPDSIIELYDREKGIDEININQSEEKLNIYLKQSSALLIGATCRTAIEPEEQRRGTYGIVYELVFNDNTGSGKEILRQYTFNTNQMNGQPLNYVLDNRQYSIYELDGENFVRINKIYAYQQNFPIKQNDKDNDIFIKNLELYGCNALTAEQLAGCTLTIAAPQGGFFDKNKPQDTLKLQANVRVKGQFIDKSSQDIKYYWFVEDVRVDSAHKNYNQYGGFGWRCLNNINEISSDTREWVPATYEYIINRDPDALAKINKFKCVALYGDTIISGTIDIYNRNSNYEFAIDIDTLNKSTKFYFDVGTPTITCLVNGEDSGDYEYHWIKLDNKNNSIHLPDTDTDNIIYNIKLKRYNELEVLVMNQPEVTQANKSEMDTLLTDLKKYDTIMRVESNKIYKIQISEINLFNTFKCGISKDGKYLGTASITLSNIYELEKGYSLIMNNATQIFKYDANGISPMSKGLENSTEQETLPLSFTLYDAQGNDITNEMKNKFEIEWIIPTTNTMLSFSDSSYTIDDLDENRKIIKDEESLSFKIADKYNIGYGNNIIQLKLRFKELFFTVNSNFTFAKDGEPGTNGTDFVCKIVPYTSGETPFYPMVTTKVNNTTEFNFPKQAQNIYFKVQLWHSGVLIFDGYSSSNAQSTEGYPIQDIKWEILRNKYGTAKVNNKNEDIIDYSDINISDSTDGKMTIKNYSDADENKANIIKCTLKYQNMTYCATLPLITSKIKVDGYNVKLKDNTGFLHAVYATDGRKPQYNSANPFELVVTKQTGIYTEDVSYATSINDKLEYIWSYKGSVFRFNDDLTGSWNYPKFIEQVNSKDGNINPKNFKPADAYDGECKSVALVCIIKRIRDNREIARIHIPIHLLLNKYGQSALNNWDGNSIEIEKDKGYILSPQMGAGTKDNDNSFTGVLMGKVQESGKINQEIGLFGYHKGTRSFFINSENGSAIFGKSKVHTITEVKNGTYETNNVLGGQIIVDPSSGKAMLYSSNFFAKYKENGLPETNYHYDDKTFKYNGQAYKGKANNDVTYAGALIDLSTPRILWGNGNFRVEPNGFIYAKGGGQIAGWNINDSRIDSTDKSTVKDVTNEVPLGKTGMSSVYQNSDGTYPAGAAKWEVEIPKNSTNTTGKMNKAMAFWAGGTGTRGKFHVSHDGYVRAQELTVGGGTRSDDLIFIGTSTYTDENKKEQTTSAIYTFNKPTLHSNPAKGFYLGTDGIGLGGQKTYTIKDFDKVTQKATETKETHSRFEVHSDGKLYAQSGVFDGEIYSSKGMIGGWFLGDDGLYKQRVKDTDMYVKFGVLNNIIEVIHPNDINKPGRARYRFCITNDGTLMGSGVNLGGNIDISSGSIVIVQGTDKIDTYGWSSQTDPIFKVDGNTSRMYSNRFSMKNGDIYNVDIDHGDIINSTIDDTDITDGTMKRTSLTNVTITSTSIGANSQYNNYSTFYGRLLNGTYLGSQGRIKDDGTAAGIYFGSRSTVANTAEGAYIGKEGVSFRMGNINYSFSSAEVRVEGLPKIYSGGNPNDANGTAKNGDIYIKWY